MRVLLITPAAPSKTHVNGGATRMHRLYRRLIELGESVTVVGVFTANQSETIETLRSEGFGVRAHVRPRSRLREIGAALLRSPALVRGLRRRSSKELVSSIFWVDLAPLVRDELASGEYDVVVIESSFAAYWRDEIETELPVVLVTHEVESVQQMAKGARIGGVSSLLHYIDGARIRRSEQRFTPIFDAVVTMSELELQDLTSIVGAGRMPAGYVVGNGADIDAMNAVEADPGAKRVLFTGTMAYPPNSIGAQWLANEVWPLVLNELPDAELMIVGATPPAAVLTLDELPSVRVRGDVPDMIEWFSRASVCVLPMLEGGGTRLKLTDAFAARRAVVSTTNGAAGIDCRSGHELLIADTAEDFARAIVRLLGEEQLRARLALRGRELVERKYDWRRLGAELQFVLQEVTIGGAITPLKVIVSDADA